MLCRDNWPQWCIPAVADIAGQCLAGHPTNAPLCHVLVWALVATAALVVVWLILLTYGCATCASGPASPSTSASTTAACASPGQSPKLSTVSPRTPTSVHPPDRRDKPRNAGEPNSADPDNE